MKIPFQNSILRNLILFVLAVSAVAATHAVRLSAAQQEQQNKYLKVLEGENFRADVGETESSVEEVVKTYHKNVNDMFNERISEMVKLGATGNPKDLEKMMGFVTPPGIEFDLEGLPLRRRPCGEDGRLSAYCLSLAATDEYFFFREALLEARRLAREKGSATASEEYAALIERIDSETDIARRALDQALSMYNELQSALPLHQKYLQTIKKLESYRDKISGVRKEIELFPDTFLDVTTTQCT